MEEGRWEGRASAGKGVGSDEPQHTHVHKHTHTHTHTPHVDYQEENWTEMTQDSPVPTSKHICTAKPNLHTYVCTYVHTIGTYI